MPIEVICPACSRSFHAPDATAGRRAKCPKCSCPIDIPSPVASEVLEAEADPSSPSIDQGLEVESPAALPAQDGRKPCPMCGEMIQQSAIKCRFCGEVFDPAMKGMLGTSGSIRDPGWTRVRSGLATIYNCIIIILIAIIVIVIAGIVMGGLAGAQGRRNPPIAMFVVFGIAGFVILGAGLGMLIGQILCVTVPASSGARGFAVGAVVCLIVQVLLNATGRAMNNQAISGLGNLVSTVGYILFILFIRQSAAYLGNQSLASSAGKLIIFGVTVLALFFLGAMSAVAGAQAFVFIVVLIAIVACLVWFVWYMRVLKQLMNTIDGRMNVRSIIQQAGSAAMPR